LTADRRGTPPKPQLRRLGALVAVLSRSRCSLLAGLTSRAFALAAAPLSPTPHSTAPHLIPPQPRHRRGAPVASESFALALSLAAAAASDSLARAPRGLPATRRRAPTASVFEIEPSG
jgi:hypothetical protein